MDRHESRFAYTLLRKIRSPFVAIIGLVLPNSYLTVLITKQIYDGPLKRVCVPFLNCHACPTAYMACPVGVLQHFSAIRQFPAFLIGFVVAIGMLFGRAACGWLCPFGWVQDQLHRIKSRKFGIPRFLSWGKYLSLVVLAIALPYFTEDHWFSRICPWGTLSAGIPWVAWNPEDPSLGAPVIEPGMLGWLYALKISILVVFLVLFVLTKRPFCRTLCPLGAAYALFNRVSLMRLHVEGPCVECDLCVQVCPVDIRVSDDPNAPDCIRCLKCTVCKHVSVRWSYVDGIRPASVSPASPEGR